MNYFSCLALLLFFAAQPLFCAQNTIVAPNHYTFLSDEESPNAFVIPGRLAMRCQKIVSMFEDFPDMPRTPDTLKETMKNSCAADVSRFSSYLQCIDIVNTAEENKIEKLNKILFWYVKGLRTPALINLFKTVDLMNVIDKNNHDQLVKEVTERIKDREQMKYYPDVFEELNDRGLFHNVVALLDKNGDLKFEETFMQPYANNLTEQYSPERTIPIAKIFYTNVCNMLKAPFRSWGWQWAKKNVIRPCYLNTQTGTIITGFTEQLGDVNKMVQLLITKKNPEQTITISLNSANIDKLIDVEANKTESSFICRSKGKAVVIDMADINNPIIIDENFLDCVFSDNDNELYVTKRENFGIFNTSNKTFTPLIDPEKLNKVTCFKHIKTNKDKTIIVLCATYYVGHAGTDDQIFIFNKNDGQLSCTGPTKLKSFTKIDNMCIHPCQEKLYFSCPSNRDDGNSLFCIDLNDRKNSIDLMKNCDKTTYLQFLTDDILFVGHATKDNTFFNTKTNRHWSKKKPIDDRIIFFKNKPDDYAPLMVTADRRWLLGEKRQSNMLIDLCIALNSKSNDNLLDFSTKKIAAARLIDDAMATAITRFNSGYLPLGVLKIALGHSKTTADDNARINALNPEMQNVIRAAGPTKESLWQWMRNIALVVASGTAIIFRPSGSIDTKTTRKQACAAIVAMAAMTTILLERAFAQY